MARNDLGTHWSSRPEDKIYTVRINPADYPEIVNKLEKLRGSERKKYIVSAFLNALDLPVTQESELLDLLKSQQVQIQRLVNMMERWTPNGSMLPVIPSVPETEEDEEDLAYLEQVRASMKRSK